MTERSIQDIIARLNKHDFSDKDQLMINSILSDYEEYKDKTMAHVEWDDAVHAGMYAELYDTGELHIMVAQDGEGISILSSIHAETIYDLSRLIPRYDIPKHDFNPIIPDKYNIFGRYAYHQEYDVDVVLLGPDPDKKNNFYCVHDPVDQNSFYTISSLPIISMKLYDPAHQPDSVGTFLCGRTAVRKDEHGMVIVLSNNCDEELQVDIAYLDHTKNTGYARRTVSIKNLTFTSLIRDEELRHV